MIRMLSVCLALLLAAGQAAAVTINFDDIPLGSANFQTQDFEFSANFGVRENTASYAGDLFLTGSAGFFDPYSQQGYVALRRVDLAPFAIYSADLFFGGVSIYGLTSTGQTIDAASAAEFGSGAWLNVTEVQIRSCCVPGAPVSIDNIVVGAAVPVPAAVWLFVSGLGLLGWIRSRRIQGAGKVSA